MLYKAPGIGRRIGVPGLILEYLPRDLPKASNQEVNKQNILSAKILKNTLQ
jgi:hypothetical protein